MAIRKEDHFEMRINQKRANEERNRFFYLYDEKYFNLWLNSWKWRGINRDQREYIMRRFWADGAVAAFPIIKADRKFQKGEAPSQEEGGLLGFAPFSVYGYNMYNYPTAVNLVNNRGVPYINDKKVMTNGIDVVLGYAQHSRRPIRDIVYDYINKIVDIEMTIRTNLIAQKVPFVIEVSSDSQQQANDLMRSIMNDNPALFLNVGEINSIKSVGTLSQYIIDKLYNYKQAVENELLSFMGIDNLGSSQKKEHLITSEVDSNNDLINDYSDSIGSNLKEFCDLIKEKLNFDISVEPTASPKQAEQEDGEYSAEDGEEGQEEQ